MLPGGVATQSVLFGQCNDRQGRVVQGNPLGDMARSKPNGSWAKPFMDDKNTVWKKLLGGEISVEHAEAIVRAAPFMFDHIRCTGPHLEIERAHV